MPPAAVASCLMLLIQCASLAVLFAPCIAGISIDARTAATTMTSSSSISVKRGFGV